MPEPVPRSKVRSEITKTLLRVSGLGQAAPGPTHSDISEDRRQGAQYGSYRILKRLGTGGMGEVYLALDLSLDRHVAIKFLPPSMTSDEEILSRFQQEARTASALNHPNIVTIFEVGHRGGEHYIVSEYIQGVTLRTAIKHEVLDLPITLDLAMQVTSALIAAHSAGVVHRDLKPANIMIRDDGYVKIIDFGLAKLKPATPFRKSPSTSRRDRPTRPGAMLGTVDYMSPEQARGEDVDERTDIWSLGVVLYEMVVKRRPFVGETESHLVVEILDKPMPLCGNGVPPVMANILARALQKDRTKRYQTADHLYGDLKEARRVLGFGVDSAPLAVPLRRLGRRRAAWRWSLIALAAAVLLLTALWWWAFDGREVVRGPAWIEVASAAPATANGKVRFAAISPDGSRIAYVAGDPERQSLHLKNLKSGIDIEKLRPAAQRFAALTFSPEGEQVFYMLRGTSPTLYSLPVDQEGARLVLTDVNSGAAFSPDGQKFAVLHISEGPPKTEEIQIADMDDTGKPRTIARRQKTQLGLGIAWSPSGNTIADILYSRRVSGATLPVIALFRPQSRPEDDPIKTFAVPGWRGVDSLAFINRGRILLVSAISQGRAEDEGQIQQISVATGRTRELTRDGSGYADLSATRDGQTVAAVRTDRKSAIWITGAAGCAPYRRVTPLAERFESVAWLNRDTLITPSSRGGNINLWSMGSNGMPIYRLTNESFVDRMPAAIPGESALVFSSNRAMGGDDFNLWKLDLGSHQLRQITFGSSFDTEPAVSPDGKWIVYTSWPTTSSFLWKVASTPPYSPSPLTSFNSKGPAFSPDGKHVACHLRFSTTQPWNVLVISFPDGSVERQFHNIPEDSPLAWTPDGRGIAFTKMESGTSNLWVQPLTGEAPQLLTHFKDSLIFSFAWPPSGSQLAVVRGTSVQDVVLFSRQ